MPVAGGTAVFDAGNVGNAVGVLGAGVRGSVAGGKAVLRLVGGTGVVAAGTGVRVGLGGMLQAASRHVTTSSAQNEELRYDRGMRVPPS